MGLIIKADSNRVTEEEVRKVGVPPYTRSFMPVRNDEFLDMVYRIATINFTIILSISIVLYYQKNICLGN